MTNLLLFTGEIPWPIPHSFLDGLDDPDAHPQYGGERPVIGLATFPDLFDSRSFHNTGPWGQDGITLGAEYGSDEQYAIAYRHDRRAVLTKTMLSPNGVANSVPVRDVINNLPFLNTIGASFPDEHCVLAMMVDLDGYLHIAGNMHNCPLKYVRSVNPIDTYDLDNGVAFTAPGMIGPNPWPDAGETGGITTSGDFASAYAAIYATTATPSSVKDVAKPYGEEACSYPFFIRMNDGTVLFLYRRGASGSAHVIMNRLVRGTAGAPGTWERLSMPGAGALPNVNALGHNMIEGIVSGFPNFSFGGGSATDQSPYWFALQHGKNDDDIGVWVTWRTQTPDQNNDLSFAWLHGLSAGGTPSATKADGTPITLPLTRSNMETVFSVAGMPNFGGADVDDDNNPHIFVRKPYLGFSEYHHIYHDGAAWQTIPISNQQQSAGSPGAYSSPVPAGAMACIGSRTFVVFRSRLRGQASNLWLYDITDDDNPFKVPLIEDWDLMDQVPALNTRAAKERSEIQMFVSPTFSDDTVTGTEDDVPYFGDSINWQQQYGAVLSVDLRQANRVTNRALNVPKLVRVGSPALYIPSTPGTVTTSGAILELIRGVPISPSLHGRPLFVRFDVIAQTNANNSATFELYVEFPGLVTYDPIGRAKMPINTLTYEMASTGWIFIPVSTEPRAWDRIPAYATLKIIHGTEQNGSISIWSAAIEFATLGPDDLLTPVNPD